MKLNMPQHNLLKKIFPAAGISPESIEITDIKPTKNTGVLVGFTQLPFTGANQKVVVYHAINENGEDDYRVISAACPHQGADISRDELKPDGNVYCSLHKRPICVFSKFNQAFAVEKRGEKFFIMATQK